MTEPTEAPRPPDDFRGLNELFFYKLVSDDPTAGDAAEWAARRWAGRRLRELAKAKKKAERQAKRKGRA